MVEAIDTALRTEEVNVFITPAVVSDLPLVLASVW